MKELACNDGKQGKAGESGKARPGLIILGIDPGSRHTGYGIIEDQEGQWTVRASGRFSAPANQPVAERLGRLSQDLVQLLSVQPPDLVAVEKPFHGINARSALVLAEARGALLAVLSQAGIEIQEFAPAEIKSAVSGSGRADKAQVARMVRLQLRCPNLALTADASDALAVALCAAFRLAWSRRIRPKASR